MHTITASPGLMIDLLPKGAESDPWHTPAVRIRRQGGDSIVVYLPEVKGLIEALAWAAGETAGIAAQGEER